MARLVQVTVTVPEDAPLKAMLEADGTPAKLALYGWVYTISGAEAVFTSKFTAADTLDAVLFYNSVRQALDPDSYTVTYDDVAASLPRYDLLLYSSGSLGLDTTRSNLV
jgi:hypothetical protein